MATFSVSDSTALRNAIQAALPGDLISLVSSSPYSVTTLAKVPSFVPAAIPGSGYTISGNGATIQNTRILQQNIDGPFGPAEVSGTTNNLNLVYTAGGAADGTALLRATSATYTLNRVNLNGVHRGWDGNSNLYMSLTSFNPANPVNVSLNFRFSAVNITGQGGFTPTSSAPTAGGTPFLHSWNNTGNVTLENVNFNENGYLSSFFFYTFEYSPVKLGSYAIKGNTFRRTSPASRVVRHTGNILRNVTATVEGNVFQDGAYLDLISDASAVTFVGTNAFTTLAGGFGIRASGAAPGDLIVGNPSLQATAQLIFSGPGLPVRYFSTTDGVFRLDTLGGADSRNISIGAFSFQEVIAGSQAGNSISAATSTTNVWINGDDGDDSITGSKGNDQLLGGLGTDTIDGGIGSDSIDGGAGNDSLIGSFGNDNLFGSADNDWLNGGLGQDLLSGGTGNDTLIGAASDDTLTGGTGADVFQLVSNDLFDTITDFSIAEDVLAIPNLAGSPLPANQFLSPLKFDVVSSLSALTAGSNNKVVEIQNGETAIDIEFGSYAAIAAYVIVFNSDSGVAELWLDDNWSDNFGDRFQMAQLTNITSAAEVATFTSNNFFIL